MQQIVNAPTRILSGLSLLIFFLLVIGCGSSADLETQISGEWKLDQGDGTVVINLAKDGASLTIDGHHYPAVVENVDRGTNTVQLKVENRTGTAEAWSIHQVWNDNGSAFKLTFRHNGTSDTLVPVGHS